MFAIFKSGGKQYKVKAGDVIRVEKLPQDLGAEFDLTEVLCVTGEKTFVGEPILDKAKVRVVVTNQSKAPKVIVFKKNRRQGYRRMKGHRQTYTELFVKEITSPDGEKIAADSKPQVYDPVRKQELIKKKQEEKKADKKAGVKKTKKKAKKVAKKAATKKKTAKKSAAKKKTAKKKTTGKKKTAKKKATKKTKKKS